ncbi:MAG: hypothetical protein HY862_17250 [Chloroflexi bacterium]|nr:hypothetical protein [Chloroflexota bacterium]
MTEELLLKSVQMAKDGQQKQARQLVDEYTQQNPFDARGWWVMANIVTDPDAKRTALIHLLELKPDNAKARAMLEELEVESVFSLGALTSANQTSHPFAQNPKIRIRTANILLVGGALILVAILLLGAGWYTYTYQHSGLFGLFGPDLSNEATTDQYSMRYPEDWEGRVVSFQTQNQKGVVAASDRLDPIAQMVESQPSADTAINVLTGGNLDSLNIDVSNESETSLSSDDFEERLHSFGAVIFAPVSQGHLAQIQLQLDNTIQTQDGFDLFGFRINANTETEDIKIGGENGKLTLFHLSVQIQKNSMELSSTDSIEINISYYLASTQHHGQTYVFFMVAFEESPGSQARTARRIIHSIRFE